MLRSAGESFGSAETPGACANPAVVATTSSRRAAIRFMMSSHVGKKFVAAVESGHEAGLLDRANSIGLTRAARLPRTRMVAVATAVSRRHIGEGGAVTVFVDVHAVTDACTELGSSQNPGYRP